MPNTRVSTYDMIKWLQTLHSKGITKFKKSELPDEYNIDRYFKKAYRQEFIFKIGMDDSNKRPVAIWAIDEYKIKNISGMSV